MEMHPIPLTGRERSAGYRIAADQSAGPRDRAGKPRTGLNATQPADALPLGGAGGKPTREHVSDSEANN